MFKTIESTFSEHFPGPITVKPANYTVWLLTAPQTDEIFINYNYWVKYMVKLSTLVGTRIMRYRRVNREKHHQYLSENQNLLAERERVAGVILQRLVMLHPEHPAATLSSQLPDFSQMTL